MDELEKAYQAMEMLKMLGMPVSQEQMKAITRMEGEYIDNTVIPKIKELLALLMADFYGDFVLDMTYDPETGVHIESPISRPVVVPQSTTTSAAYSNRQKKGVIKVTFPDGKVVCHPMVSQTMVDVVKIIGPEKVRQAGIRMNGNDLVSKKLYERYEYRRAQKPVGNGFYVNTLSSTGLKFDQLCTINKLLHLNLKIERV
ncbi:MAG: hypothetical protein J5529_04410 [Prevotella sp.]|nr:hypothetical protein [Prevotella sp.]